MHKKIAIAAVIGAFVAGCATQQPAVQTTDAKPAAKPAAAQKAPPALMSGASAAMLANTCAGCHGTHGASSGPAAPTIGGLSEDYMIEVMAAYKSGDRASTIMGRIAQGYSDGEIAAMAKFYANQTYEGRIQTSTGPKAIAGRKLHEEYCEKCHEDEGRSIADDSGLLAGQWMPYLHWTLDDYAAGKNSGEKRMLQNIEKMLAEHGPSSIENLVHYYGSRK
jgi:sulfide dehydrogenase cytochrome subunit